MSEDIEAGDLVVVVRTPRPLPGLLAPFDPAWRLKLGSIHRVERVLRVADGIGLHISSADHRPFGGWAIELFKKLPKADDTFTAQMRAVRPHKAGVPA